jgi:hypothetical protein
MDKSLLELKDELDSVAIQLALLDDFAQTFSLVVFDALGSTLAPEQLLALKETFLHTLKQQQYLSLDELQDTISPATIERNRLRVHRNISVLRQNYGL